MIRAALVCLLASAFWLPAPAFGTTVTGKVSDSSGAAVAGAAVNFRLINIGRGNVARVTGTSIVAPTILSANSAADGTFSVTLVGNDAITPAGTLYEVVIRGPGFTYGPFDYSITGSAADLNSLTPQATFPNTPSQVPSSALAAPSGCASNQVLEWTGTAWACATAGSGSGAQHQVNGTNLTANATINLENSAPTNGLTLTFANPSAGNVQLGLSGTLADAGLASSYSGTGSCAAHQWIASLTRNGAPVCSQPAYTDISGTPTLPQNTPGVAHQFLTAYNSTTGAFTLAQPAYGDISGTPTLFNQTIDANGIAQTQRPAFNFSTNFSVADNSVSNRTDLDLASTISSNTSGNAATSTALAATPTQCTAGQFATGVAASGNANCGTPSASVPNPLNTVAIQDKGGQVYNVKAYGAVGNGVSLFDATMASTGATLGATGNTAAPATPGGTTHFNNEVVMHVYANLTGTFAGPSGPTLRASVPWATGCNDGIWAGESSVATAGAFSGFTASQTSNFWDAINIPLVPSGASAPAFVSVSTGSNCSSTPSNVVTINAPASLSAGNTLLACISFWPDGTFYYLTPSGWSPVSTQTVGSTSGVALTCWMRTVTASEPASYSFTFAAHAGGGGGGFIAQYSGVAAIDQAVTSASASFASTDVGKLACVETPDPRTTNYETCGLLGAVANPTTVYGTFGNPGTTSATGVPMKYATDDSAAFTAAFNAATAAGGIVYMPPGSYGVQQSYTFPVTSQVSLVGSGSSRTIFENSSGTITGTAPQSGSAIWVLSNGITGPELTLNATNPWQPNTRLADFTLWAGAGVSRNSATGDGIDILSPATSVDRVLVGNFGGDGIKILTGASTFNSLVFLNQTKSVSNGAAGLETALGVGGAFNQNVNILGGSFEFNGSYGIYLNGQTDVVNITNAIIQENNLARTSGLYEIFFVNVKAATLQSSWIESDDSSTMDVGVNSTATAISIAGNWFQSTVNAPIALSGPTGVKITANNSNIASFLTAGSTSHLATIDNTNRMSGDGGLGAFGKSFTGTSGTASGYENLVGGAITTTFFLNGYANTGAAQTWTFPVAYATTPILQESGGSCGAQNPSVSATVLTLPANAAMTAETCQVTVTGQQP